MADRENHDREPADREKKQQTSANVAKINDGPRNTFSSGTWLKRTLQLKWILCSCGSRNNFWSFMGDPNTVAQEQYDWAYEEQQWLPQWRVLPIPGEEDLKIIIKNPLCNFCSNCTYNIFLNHKVNKATFQNKPTEHAHYTGNERENAIWASLTAHPSTGAPLFSSHEG